jgi:hypothetical protein
LDQFRRIDLEYRLVTHGVATPNTQSKTWFFAIPGKRDNDAAWRELLNRLFYDANVLMKRREPGDAGWLALDSYRSSALDPAHILAWNGKTDEATTREYLPWFLSARAVVWEGSACWIVDDSGRYDALRPYDYCELMLDVMLGAGTAGPERVVSFLDKLYPGSGQKIYDDRAQRIANIKVVRAPGPGVFRREPGSEPVASGPPSAADLAG